MLERGFFMSSIQVIWASKNYYPVGSGFKGHSHKYYQMFCVTTGAGQLVIDGQSHLLGENQMAFVRADEQHALTEIDQGTLKLYDIKFSITDADLRERIDALPTIIQLEDAAVSDYFKRIRNEFRNKRPCYGEIAACLTESLLWELLRMRQPDETAHPVQLLVAPRNSLTGIAKKIAEYVETNYFQPLSNDQIAKELGYNKNYCCMVFRQDSGRTIGEYLNMIRIYNAVNAIANTEYSFSDIAQNVGFKNVYHFSRVFKRITGYTPSDIRELEREGLYQDRMTELLDPYRFEEEDSDVRESF